MADKYGRKPMMMWAIFIYSVGTGLSGIATNLYMLAVCRFIVGLGMSGEYACASTYAVESWPKNLQSKASAFGKWFFCWKYYCGTNNPSVC